MGIELLSLPTELSHMKLDDLLDDIREKVEFPVSESDLLDEFGDIEFQHSEDVPVDESEVTTFAAALEREEELLEQGKAPEERTYETPEDIRDSLVPPQM